MWDVVVIGAGYCGVTAAIEIQRRMPEARILLLEAADRLGGRARSFPVPTEVGTEVRQSLDLGAHYFGSHHTRVRVLAQRLLEPAQIYNHVPTYGTNPASLTFIDGRWNTTTLNDSVLGMQGLDKNSSLYDRVCIFKSLCWYLAGENLIDTRAPWRTPFAAWLDHRSVAHWVDRQRLPQWVREMWRLACLDILSIEPEKISLLYWIWYQSTNGGFFQIANDRTRGPQEFSVDIGLGGLLERYATEFTGTTRLSTPVHTIDHSAPDTVVLTTTDGERIEARRAVVAVTPHAAGRHLRFSPPLSSARQQFHEQPIGHAAKAVIVYPTPWWRSCHGYHYFSLSAGAFAEGVEWALDTSHPDGRQYSLTVFVGERLFARLGPQASAPQTRAESIHLAITQELAEAFDDARALKYTHLELHRWQEVRYVGGGPNTHLRPGTLSRLEEAFNRPEGPLYFASSEQSTVFTGYVEGAIAAGERVAAQLASDASRAADPSRGGLMPETSPESRGPRYLRALGFLLGWALLAPFAELIRLIRRR